LENKEIVVGELPPPEAAKKLLALLGKIAPPKSLPDEKKE
jgi:hypothetical protein